MKNSKSKWWAKSPDGSRKPAKPEAEVALALGQKKRCEIICRCNNIDRETIEKAIAGGARTMNEIFDATTAGVGPCGGSCRRKLQPLLEYYLQYGKFPDKPSTS